MHFSTTSLTHQIDALLAEKLELQGGATLDDQAKTELNRRIKELQDKLRDEVEVRDRELQGVRAALKKASEEKDASNGASKAQVTI